jgi:hypothetical protein
MRRVTYSRRSLPAPYRKFNARESIQIGTPGRWMLGLMRAICAHVEAVERKLAALESDAARDAGEGKLVVCDQQK